MNLKTSKRSLGLNRKYNFNQQFFENIDNEHKAYWLGFIVADGNVSVRKCGSTLSITSIDYDHLEKFKDTINHVGPIRAHGEKNCYRFEVHSIKIVSDLIKLGVVPRKSRCTVVPHLSNDLVNHFIRGVFDGDGTIGFYGDSWRLSIVSGNPQFIIDLKKIITRNDIKGGYISHQKSVDNLTFGGSCLPYKFANFIYKDANIYLDRKYEKYLELCGYIENPINKLNIKIFKPCNIKRCCKVQYAKGLCRYHYDQKRYYGENFEWN
jgi:hypothetical protein